MPMMELMATVESPDPEPRVRSRVVRFLTSRGYRPTDDPSEFKRGSLFGSLTGFSPKRWGTIVRFKNVEPGVFWFRFHIDTTGQTVVAKEREFWEQEKAALTSAIEGRPGPELETAEREVSSHGKKVLGTILFYSLLGGVLFGAVGLGVSAAGTELFPGLLEGIGAGLGATVGWHRALSKS